MPDQPIIHKVAVVLCKGFIVLDVYGPVQAFASCRKPQEEKEYRWNEIASDDPLA